MKRPNGQRDEEMGIYEGETAKERHLQGERETERESEKWMEPFLVRLSAINVVGRVHHDVDIDEEEEGEGEGGTQHGRKRKGD